MRCSLQQEAITSLIRLWDLQTGESTPLITDDKTEPAFSPDGKWLALRRYTAEMVELWERKGTTYHKRQSLPAARTIGYQLKFSPDSKILVFRGPDNAFGLWDVAVSKSVGVLPDHRDRFCATAFDPTGKTIATGSGGMIRIWEVGSQRLISIVRDQEEIRSLCFTPDNKILIAASGSEEIRRWDVIDPERPKRLAPMRGHTAFIPQLAISPDGKTLASVSYDSTLRLWDVEQEQELATLRGHKAVAQSVVWAPDGQTIFTGGGDAIVRIWHAPSWEEIEADR